ncbi:putative enzyme related to lactoylglutathione lyase [Okibacterium sp. HSC-33S16]|uniref:VOC family protein n=1 Tax=Okibacterium sp. HSC-33S16 TaxID=2910965 RepID=UPI0020A17264|nr:VOC family protein [Okibacterium sp. HSC-33S16]MCP2031312.1 putative enzyme related to lactoylglutathione lyase [Okibacterium sp. HSC-33S16]
MDEKPSAHDSVLRSVDAITVPVPDLDQGLQFYCDRLHQKLLWRNDAVGQAGVALPGSDTELVVSTTLAADVNWLVASVTDALADIVAAGGTVVAEPVDIPVGRAAVAADPFGNRLVLLDLSKGRYVTDASGQVIEVAPDDISP